MPNNYVKVPPKKLPDLTILNQAPYFESGWWYGSSRREKYVPIAKVNKSGVFYCVVGDHCWKKYKYHLRSFSRDDISYLDVPERICKLHEKAVETTGE